MKLQPLRGVFFLAAAMTGNLAPQHFTESQQLWKQFSPDVLGQDRPGFRFHMLYACAWQACHE
jgi:hypothetical protein